MGRNRQSQGPMRDEGRAWRLLLGEGTCTEQERTGLTGRCLKCLNWGGGGSCREGPGSGCHGNRLGSGRGMADGEMSGAGRQIKSGGMAQSDPRV
jgi:hypothetical protein